MGAAHKGKAEKQAMDNRELSWLKFNSRIQDEADHLDNPLLERAKFLAIVTSNMDEFLQVRYERIYRAAYADARDEKAADHLAAEKLYRKVNKQILRQCNRQYTMYEGIRSELYLKGVQLYPTFLLDETLSDREKTLFEKKILPVLKVEDLKAARPVQKQLYICVKLVRPRKGAQFKLVALPASLPRLYDLSATPDVQCLIKLEDIVKHHIYRLFPREEVEHSAVLRIVRNQNFETVEKTKEDVVPAVRRMLGKRPDGAVMRLEAEESMSEEMLTLLMKRFGVELERRYRVTGPLDLNKLLMGLYNMIRKPELKYPIAQPVELPELMGDDIFDRIDERDWLMYHPYHSFQPVVHMMQRAAEDPTVKSIKQTLYRVSGSSPITAALIRAAENGKDVLVLFEAHARFDEEHNLACGDKLEHAGCRVIYGLPNKKVHSKITLIEREVEGEIRREVHLGTGNYHDGTAKLYTDFGLLTADEQLTEDAVAFFDTLQGIQGEMKEIVKAPDQLKPRLLELIRREAQHAEAGRPARILAKMNSLSDKKIIRALMEASKAGVEINLIVRGICCLIPEIEDVTENIHVRSIVGRQLEHARAFLFENGGETEVYLSSADWMPRNLDRRVELMFPIKDERCRQAIENVLTLQWNDTQKCRHCDAEGVYELHPRKENGLNAQEVMIENIAGVFDGTVSLCTPETEQQEEEMEESVLPALEE